MPRRAPAKQHPGLFEDLPVAVKPTPPLPPLIGLPTSIGRSRAAPTLVPTLETADDEVDADNWFRRLAAAFARHDPPDGFLPLAERALAACPGDIDLLLLAANAALIDGRHERALVFLKRFHKRAESPAEHLLRAFAVHLAGLRAAAKTMLERHGLSDPLVAFKYYPAGMSQVDWFVNRFNEIKQEERPARPSFPRAGKAAGNPVGASAGKGRKIAAPEPAAARQGIAGADARNQSCPVRRKAAAGGRSVCRRRCRSSTSTFRSTSPSTSRRSVWPSHDRRPSPTAAPSACASGSPISASSQGFDELLCLPHLVGVEPLWHQIETVRKVLKQFRGRVLLADEVGLGKTIEAGMVLKEYALRGMAERVLVLTPASLVGQWREELETKFGLAFATTYDPLLREDAAAFWDQPRIVASIATARRREHVEALAARPFDIVIVDEAHHLRDRASASWKLVDALNKRFLLLLSATPVQNDLVELYNLLTLLKPGIFKTLKEFRAAYMTPGKPRQPANPDAPARS